MLLFALAVQLALAEDSTDLWQQALRYHDWLSTDAVSQCHNIQAAVRKVTLQPVGFHGHIKYIVSHQQAMISDTCMLTVLQPLPAGVYADPYELENILTAPNHQCGVAFHMSAFKLFGTVDVEKIESDCNATVLSVSGRFDTSGNGAQLCDSVKYPSLSVPLHARYPAPHLHRSSGVIPFLMGSQHQYNLEQPKISMAYANASLAFCPATSVVEAESVAPNMQLHWIVPAGGVWHVQVVQAVTAFTAVSGLYVLLHTILLQHQKVLD